MAKFATCATALLMQLVCIAATFSNISVPIRHMKTPEIAKSAHHL
jgi:hypothetical protein